MIQYPNIDPVIFRISDSLQIRWYGLMYVFAFAIAWCLLRARGKKTQAWNDVEVINDFFFYVAIGVLAGGRIGYILFYNLPSVWSDPVATLKIWQGGMSFHGGLLGVILAMAWFAHRYKMTFLEVADFAAPSVPLGLGLGRLGNFINGELWGKPTDVPWAMVFPHAGDMGRHPSQLYSFALEGLLLFTLLWWYSSKPRSVGNVSGFFLVGYGCIRIFEEFFRAPDPQYGYLAFGWLTMGQLLSLPMILVGIFFFAYQPKNREIRENS